MTMRPAPLLGRVINRKNYQNVNFGVYGGLQTITGKNGAKKNRSSMLVFLLFFAVFRFWHPAKKTKAALIFSKCCPIAPFFL